LPEDYEIRNFTLKIILFIKNTGFIVSLKHTKKPTQWAGSVCIVQLDYALPSEPNTSIRSSTDAWIAFTPSAKNLRGSKSFFLSYSASFAS